MVSAGLDVSGLLLHKDDVFVHVSHRDGYEGPMTVEEEGFLAGSPMVCNSPTSPPALRLRCSQCCRRAAQRGPTEADPSHTARAYT